MFSVVYVTLTNKIRVLFYLALILALLCWLSLIALGLIYALLDFYENILGISEGIVISTQGFSPLTTLISRSEIEEKLSQIANITIEYYLVTPVIIDGKVVLLRSSNVSRDCILVGENIASKLSVNNTRYIFISSIFKNSVFYLEICGFTSGSWLEAPYSLVAKIRGVPEGYYSYAVIKGSESALREVILTLGVKAENYRLIGTLITIFSRLGNETRVDIYNTLSEAYITNIGLHRDYILYFTEGVIASILIGTVVLGLNTIRSLKVVLRVYRLIGLSRINLLLISLLVGLVVVLFATIIALLFSNYIEVFTLNILDFTLKSRVCLPRALIVIIALTILYTSGVIIGVLGEIE